MAWTLDAAKVRLEIAPGDTTKDAQITLAMEMSILLAESYLNRKLLKKVDTTQSFYRVHGRMVFLERYPVESIKSIALPPVGTTMPLESVTVNPRTGGVDYYSLHGQSEVLITYTGGYDPLPADLEWALWMLFDTLYAEMEAGPISGGGGGGIVIEGSGDVKSIQIYDVGKVDYDVGTTVSNTSSGGVGASAALLVPSGRLEFILQTYARPIGPL